MILISRVSVNFLTGLLEWQHSSIYSEHRCDLSHMVNFSRYFPIDSNRTASYFLHSLEKDIKDITSQTGSEETPDVTSIKNTDSITKPGLNLLGASV